MFNKGLFYIDHACCYNYDSYVQCSVAAWDKVIGTTYLTFLCSHLFRIIKLYEKKL